MNFLKFKALKKTLSSYTFQFSIASITILSVVVMFVMLVVYGFFSYSFFHDVHSSLSNELVTVEKVYHAKGREGVADYVKDRRSKYQLNRFAYILVDTELNKLAGDLDEWPGFREYGDGWLSFELDLFQPGGISQDRDFVARSVQLPGGFQLLVARDFEVIQQYIELVVGILIRVFLVTISMGAIGSFIVSWSLQRRLDMVNKNIHTIMSGDFSERLEVVDSSSEIEKLVGNLNLMLNRIEYLMDGVKRVSDNIAHDLRTPLTRLRNHLSNLFRTCREEDRASIEELVLEVDNMLATFNALLRISRIEAGAGVTEKSVVDLRRLVRDVVELYEPVASEKQVVLAARLAPSTFVHGDTNLLFQAIANIVDNAIKYTPVEGRVEVTLRTITGDQNEDTGEKQELIDLTVADTGCGINVENREKVFRRFYREEASRSRQGNGLGLALVAAVMEKHDARILLEDNDPGLRFRVEFAAVSFEARQLKSLTVDHSPSANARRDVSTSAVS